MRRKIQVCALLVIFGLVAAVVYGCGGSSSSSTGPSTFSASGSAGSSGAVVQGQLLRGSGSAQSESAIFALMRTALGIGLAEAAPTTPLADATVTLSGPGGPFTTQTDADGKFRFTGLLPGTYTLSVCVEVAPAPCVPQTVQTGSEIIVGPGDLGTINGTVFKDTVAASVDVQAQSVTAQGILQNDAQLCIASRIAQAANVPLGTIINMRQQRMGWGNIARQENVPAGVIGGGRDCDASELSNIRAANRQGGGPGNGNGNNSNNDGNGKNNGNGNGNGNGKGKGKA